MSFPFRAIANRQRAYRHSGEEPVRSRNQARVNTRRPVPAVDGAVGSGSRISAFAGMTGWGHIPLYGRTLQSSYSRGGVPILGPPRPLGAAGAGGDGNQMVRVVQVIGASFLSSSQAQAPDFQALARGTKWSMSKSLGSVTVVPVKAPTHCLVSTQHSPTVS